MPSATNLFLFLILALFEQRFQFLSQLLVTFSKELIFLHLKLIFNFQAWIFHRLFIISLKLILESFKFPSILACFIVWIFRLLAFLLLQSKSFSISTFHQFLKVLFLLLITFLRVAWIVLMLRDVFMLSIFQDAFHFHLLQSSLHQLTNPLLHRLYIVLLFEFISSFMPELALSFFISKFPHSNRKVFPLRFSFPFEANEWFQNHFY